MTVENTIKYKGANISYSEQGKGSCLVFLHGFLGSSSIWSSFIKDLKQSFRVIAIDLPGHGNSESIGYLHSMELMADCVFEVLRTLKVRKAQIIGHSMGGYVALAFLEKYPDNCKSITLFNSTADCDSDSKKADRTRSIDVIKKNFSLYVHQVIPMLFYTEKKPHKRAISTALQMGLSASKKGVIACQEGMKIRANRELIVRFSPCPVLYLIGKHDPVLNYNDLISQANQSEQASYFLSESGGHMCMYEDQGECLSALKSFLKKN